MSLRVSSILVALALLGLTVGCSESPNAQYEAGQAAIESARTAEAEQYAPDLLQEATDSLNAALVEMQKQDGRFFAIRSYGQSKETFISAQQLADKAAEQAAVEKQRVRLADSSLIVEIESLITDTRNLLATAPKGKGSRADLKVMQADVDAAAGMMATATSNYEAGRYLAAKERLETIKTQVTKVKSDIQTALQAMTKR